MDCKTFRNPNLPLYCEESSPAASFLLQSAKAESNAVDTSEPLATFASLPDRGEFLQDQPSQGKK